MSGGDSATLRRSEFEESSSDSGVDFVYMDRDGRRAAIELKLSSQQVTRAQVRKWLSPFLGVAENIDRPLELWVLEPNGATLSIWSPQAADPQNFGLFEVVSSDSSSSFEEGSTLKVSSSYIEHRAQRWIQDIDRLFSDVANWVEPLGYTSKRLAHVPMDEELMHRFGVKSVPLTMLSISRGKTVIATLVPVALWVVGANGRVDLLTAKDSFILINAAAFPKDARWLVVSETASRRNVPPADFNRAFLETILNKNEAA